MYSLWSRNDPNVSNCLFFMMKMKQLRFEGNDESVKKNYEFFGFEYPKDKF